MTPPLRRSLASLRIEPAADQILRAWVVVRRGCHEPEPPVLPMVSRAGHHAAEWGVAVLAPLEGAQVLVTSW